MKDLLYYLGPGVLLYIGRMEYCVLVTHSADARMLKATIQEYEISRTIILNSTLHILYHLSLLCQIIIPKRFSAPIIFRIYAINNIR